MFCHVPIEFIRNLVIGSFISRCRPFQNDSVNDTPGACRRGRLISAINTLADFEVFLLPVPETHIDSHVRSHILNDSALKTDPVERSKRRWRSNHDYILLIIL